MKRQMSLSYLMYLPFLVCMLTAGASISCATDDDDTPALDDDQVDDDLIDDDQIDDDTADDDGVDDDVMDDDVVDDDGVDDDAVDDDVTDDDLTDDDLADDDATDDDLTDDDATDDDLTDDDATDDDTGPPACADYGSPQVVGNIGTALLAETSGLAVSLSNPGVIWAHNDSGDGPYLYALALDGTYLGTVTLVGIAAVDWEDMAVGPCGSDECLYVGDIGDNGASRTDCVVYRVVEPLVDPFIPFGTMDLNDWEAFPFSYPDGPQDAEALAVHADEQVYIFSKYPGGTSHMFVFPSLTPDVPVTLDFIGDLDSGGAMALTTAADIHRNGRRLLLRTYLTAVEWRIEPGTPFEDIGDGERLVVPTGVEIQGESIAYDPATGAYLHTSEGNQPPLYRIACE